LIVGAEKLTETIEKLLERIAADDEDGSGELAEVDEVFVVVAIHYGSAGDNPDAEVGNLYYRCTSARVHVQLGMVEHARRAIDASIRAQADDDDDGGGG
jgi:hypothetical protein